VIIISGSPVIDRKEPKHEGHNNCPGGSVPGSIQRGQRGQFHRRLPFATFVSFVVENGLPVKNHRALFLWNAQLDIVKFKRGMLVFVVQPNGDGAGTTCDRVVMNLGHEMIVDIKDELIADCDDSN